MATPEEAIEMVHQPPADDASSAAESGPTDASTHEHAAHSPGLTLVKEILAEPEADSREINAWVFQDFVNSPYSQVATGAFIPLAVQTAALLAAGYGDGCPNVTTNSTFVREMFPNAESDVDRAYFWVDPPHTDCPDPGNPKCIGDWCQGLPGSVAACRSADGRQGHPLQVSGIDATAYAALLQSLAVAAEVLMFLSFGSLADFGGTKRKAFLAASVLGAITTLFFGGLTPDTWWLAGPVVIISNVMFGFSSMLLSAFLPGIVRGLPTVQRAAADIALQYFPDLTKAAGGTVSISVLQQGDLLLDTAGDTPGDASPPLQEATQNATAEAPTPEVADSPVLDTAGGPEAAAPGTLPPGQQLEAPAAEAAAPSVVPMSAVGSAAESLHAEQHSSRAEAQSHMAASVGGISTKVAGCTTSAGDGEDDLAGTLPSPQLHISAKTAALSSLFQLVEHEGNVLSNRGYGTGYAGGLTCLILVIPFTIFLDDILLAYNLGIVVAGLWWLGGIIILAPRIKDRHGRERPPNKNILQLSVQGLFETIEQIRQLPQSRNFLLCWFLLSDGVSVQVTVGALFANSFVEWGCIPKSIGLAVVIMMIPLFGIMGNYGALWASRRYGWSPKSVVQGILVITCVVPLYGLVGFSNDSIGIHQGFELFYIAPILGVASALTQAFSRSVFVTLIPAGYESSWSSLFELTNKSSSFVGPAVVAAFAQAGMLRVSFVYILFMLLVPATTLFWVDERLGAREARNYSKQQLALKLQTPAADSTHDDCAAKHEPLETKEVSGK